MSRLITIHPPLAGIVRGRGFQRTPPYSCREAVNFVPQFVFDGSEQLGIRPPMAAFDTPGTTVNLLAGVNGTTAQTPQRTFVAGRAGTLYRWTGAAFTAVGGAGTIPSGRAAFAQAFEQKVYIPAFTPLVYDYPTDTLGNWVASTGTVPGNTRILVYWAGGLWTAQDPDEPHIVSGCRTGNPLDWNFNAEDDGAAFSTIGDNAGLISDPVTALIPIDGDSMIVSGPDSMQIWRGHPRRGGVADILSHSVGVRGQGAWAQGSDGTIYAVTNKGFVAIQGGRNIAPISEDRIPAELIGFDYDYLDPRISCAFDAKFNAVHICIRDATNPQAWWYDLKHGGLFQIELAAYPHVMMRFDPAGSGRASEVLFGGAGYGGISHYNLDGTESISNARVVIGPMKLTSSPLTRAKIQEASIVLGGGTTAVDAEVGFYCGPTPDSSYAAATSGEAAAKYQTTVDRVFSSQGRIRPMVAGHGLSFVLDHSTAQNNPKLVFDEATLSLTDAGKERGYVMHSDTTGPRAGSFVPPPYNFLRDLVAYFTMDEASYPYLDSHEGGFSLVPASGTPTFASVAGQIGSAVEFPPDPAAPTNNLQFSSGLTTSNLNPENGMTIWFWYKTDSGTPEGSGMNFVFFVEGVAMFFRWQDFNNSFELSLAGTSAQIVDSAFSYDVFDGDWHFIAVVYDPVTGVFKLRINDETQSTAMGAVSWGFGSYNIGLHVGGGFFGGVVSRVDEYGISQAALTNEALDTLWNNGDGLTYPLS